MKLKDIIGLHPLKAFLHCHTGRVQFFLLWRLSLGCGPSVWEVVVRTSARTSKIGVTAHHREQNAADCQNLLWSRLCYRNIGAYGQGLSCYNHFVEFSGDILLQRQYL